MKKYSVEIHVEGLLYILSMNNPCTFCPADMMGYDGAENECNICHDFIDAKVITCPCYPRHRYTGIGLGKKEAIKRTWIALEEGGWLD